eukprot:TRINITY_DN4410_c0_g1_i1.p1 TRINITY_DN4410_c0_g1~~TRINITY_DN4410_c0_g1_i1.p1  ORF type:complete len:324 (+),score=52.68 TRINITY_DN4410_c0_g1_i1:119-1090(+)
MDEIKQRDATKLILPKPTSTKQKDALLQTLDKLTLPLPSKSKLKRQREEDEQFEMEILGLKNDVTLTKEPIEPPAKKPKLNAHKQSTSQLFAVLPAPKNPNITEIPKSQQTEQKAVPIHHQLSAPKSNDTGKTPEQALKNKRRAMSQIIQQRQTGANTNTTSNTVNTTVANGNVGVGVTENESEIQGPQYGPSIPNTQNYESYPEPEQITEIENRQRVDYQQSQKKGAIEMGRDIRMRGAQVISIDQDQLKTHNYDQAFIESNLARTKLPPRQAFVPNATHKRKHQLSYLSYDAQVNKASYDEKLARDKKTRAQINSKLGFRN